MTKRARLRGPKPDYHREPVELVRAGFASATPHRVRAGRETMEVAGYGSRGAGREALAAANSR